MPIELHGVFGMTTRQPAGRLEPGENQKIHGRRSRNQIAEKAAMEASTWSPACPELAKGAKRGTQRGGKR